MIDLLAITDDLTLPSAPVGAVRSGELCVLYAPAPAPEQEVTAESLWRREEMLEALMGERDLLPVRYGTLVADEHAAAEAVAERGAELAAGLDRVRGAVELALRVRSREAAAPAAAPVASGREYLRAKAAGAETATRLHEPLAALARESVTRGGSDLLRAAYLVDRDAVEPFVALVRRLQDAHPDLALLCTGPWPPYSFAGEAGTP